MRSPATTLQQIPWVCAGLVIGAGGEAGSKKIHYCGSHALALSASVSGYTSGSSFSAPQPSLSPPGPHGAAPLQHQQPVPENEVVLKLQLQVSRLEAEVGFLSEMCLGDNPLLPIASPAQTLTSTPVTVTNDQKIRDHLMPGVAYIASTLPQILWVCPGLVRWAGGEAGSKNIHYSGFQSSLFPSPSPDIPLAPLSPPPQPSLSPPGPHGAAPLQHQ